MKPCTDIGLRRHDAAADVLLTREARVEVWRMQVDERAIGDGLASW
jgi:hypothetical protein